MSSTLGRVSRGETYAHLTDLEVEVCGACGVFFAAPAALLRAGRADHSREFYCPNGHNLSYTGQTEAEKQRERAERALARADRLAQQTTELEARLRSQKAATTRAKKRAAGAVCPCCNRSFVQLRRHLETKHPNYKP